MKPLRYLLMDSVLDSLEDVASELRELHGASLVLQAQDELWVVCPHDGVDVLDFIYRIRHHEDQARIAEVVMVKGLNDND